MPSATRSSVTVRPKAADPRAAPAGMVMVKASGEAEKSALPAVSAVTDTGICIGVSRASETVAVTFISVVLRFSLTRWGATDSSIRLSSSVMTTVCAAAVRPGAETAATMVSSPSGRSSSMRVRRREPFTVRVLAGRVTSVMAAGVKSAGAEAVPPDSDTSNAVSSAGGVTPAGSPAV